MMMKTKEEITNELTQKRRQIVSMKENLKYADHGAYGQDEERISVLEREVEQLGKELIQLI